MLHMKKNKRKCGQSMVEVALILTVIALGLIILVGIMGVGLTEFFTSVVAALSNMISS